MLIAISAPPDVDKSAVAQRLAGNGAPIEGDPSKALCHSYGFQTLYEMPADLQKTARRRLLTEHLARLEDGRDGVFAFSAVEWLADWMRWLWSATPTEEWEEIVALAQRCIARYDVIHHLDSGPKKAYDGFVWFDRRNAEQQRLLMHMLYGSLGVAGKVQAVEASDR